MSGASVRPGSGRAWRLRYERSDWRSHREAYCAVISVVREWAASISGDDIKGVTATPRMSEGNRRDEGEKGLRCGLARPRRVAPGRPLGPPPSPAGPLGLSWRGRDSGRASQCERLSCMRTSEVVPGDALLTQALARPTFKEVTRK